MKEKFLFLATFLLFGFIVAAQPGPPAPLDGGLGLLIAAGVAFGAKKAYDYNRSGRK